MMIDTLALEKMNSDLQGSDDAYTRQFASPEKPICMIIGPPRSGSTLLYQLLASTLEFAYPSNVLARFWLAPATGAVMHKQIASDQFFSNFQSDRGNTIGPQEPHEWGWFWRYWMKLEDGSFRMDEHAPIDWSGLKQKMAALEHLLCAPLLFKTVLLSTNADILAQNLENALFIVTNRCPRSIFRSALRARMDADGHWEECRLPIPTDLADSAEQMDHAERTACQISQFLQAHTKRLEHIAPQNRIDVDFDDLIERPSQVIENVVGVLEKKGHCLEKRPAFSGALSNFATEPQAMTTTTSIAGFPVDYIEQLEKKYFPEESS